MSRLGVDEVGQRVERLLDDLAGLDAGAADLAEDLVRSLVELYGAGLLTILERLHAADPSAIDELAADDLVGGLMSLHDLHPKTVVQRVEEALDECRPYLGSHGGDVTLLGVDDDGTVRLRLEGTCDGCAASQVTLKESVERAVMEAAPEVGVIHVEGAVPLGEGHAPPPGVPLPISDTRKQLPLVASGAPSSSALGVGTP